MTTTWQDIGTAPRDGTPILVWWQGSVRYAEWFRAKRKDHVTGWRIYHRSYYNGVTSVEPLYWQPLPSPPSKEGEHLDELAKIMGSDGPEPDAEPIPERFKTQK